MSHRRTQTAVPQPLASLHSLQQTAVALKELVEVMAGQRGQPTTTVVTWGDLVELGLIQADQVPTDLGSHTGQ